MPVGAAGGGVSVMQAMQKKTRFYLAFEDEICDDYITEDFFKVYEENWSYFWPRNLVCGN